MASDSVCILISSLGSYRNLLDIGLGHHHLPKFQGEADQPVIPWVCLLALLDNSSFFPPVFGHFSPLPWSIKGYWEWPHNDICWLPQHSCSWDYPMGPVSMSCMSSYLKYSLTQTSSTKSTYSLLQPFPLVSGTCDSWRPVLSVKTEAKKTHSLPQPLPCPV